MLSRLDVKTIIYCKCVCKRWRDLVLDPHFVSNLHLPRTLSSPPSIIIHGLPRENINDVDTYDGRGSRGEVSVGRPGYLKWVEMQQQLDGCQLTQVASHNLSDNRYSGFSQWFGLCVTTMWCLFHIQSSLWRIYGPSQATIRCKKIWLDTLWIWIFIGQWGIQSDTDMQEEELSEISCIGNCKIKSCWNWGLHPWHRPMENL